MCLLVLPARLSAETRVITLVLLQHWCQESSPSLTDPASANTKHISRNFQRTVMVYIKIHQTSVLLIVFGHSAEENPACLFFLITEESEGERQVRPKSNSIRLKLRWRICQQEAVYSPPVEILSPQSKYHHWKDILKRSCCSSTQKERRWQTFSQADV